ncbi:hypothetical protein F5Y01DRAFT_315001 [Xylaria sp. FL0043]|nr:hypothetical protein F5Y01DRAFT_315001 [Xylaria sp. FL0043]
MLGNRCTPGCKQRALSESDTDTDTETRFATVIAATTSAATIITTPLAAIAVATAAAAGRKSECVITINLERCHPAATLVLACVRRPGIFPSMPPPSSASISSWRCTDLSISNPCISSSSLFSFETFHPFSTGSD